MQRDAAYWIEKLRLIEHPEGGCYVQTYRSAELISRRHLPQRYEGARAFGTAIYYLLNGNAISALHRLKSDEIWHFYTGCPLDLYVIDRSGNMVEKRLGSDFDAGESFQVLVEAGCWFGALANDPDSYSLVGCTVSPGFEFEDFELGDREQLLEQYPAHRSLIERLTSHAL